MPTIFQFPCSSWVSWNIETSALSNGLFWLSRWLLHTIYILCCLQKALSVNSCIKMATGWLQHCTCVMQCKLESNQTVLLNVFVSMQLVFCWSFRELILVLENTWSNRVKQNRKLAAVFQTVLASYRSALWSCAVASIIFYCIISYVNDLRGSRCH